MKRAFHIEEQSEAPYRLDALGILYIRQGYYFFSPFQLKKALCEFDPEVIHVEIEPWTPAAFQIARLNKRLKRKLLFFTWENIDKKYPFPLSAFNRFVLSNANAAIAGNVEGKENLQKRGFHKPIFVLPQLGVNPEDFSRRQEAKCLKTRLGVEGFTIGYVGRLIEAKGLLTLMRAFAELDESFQLLLLGSGPLEGELLKETEKFQNKERVKIVRTVSHQEVPKYLNCMDVLVLPSQTTPQWKEQFGHVLIEAMACEVPVIGSDSGEIPYVIGDAGLVFKEGNADELKHLIQVLAANETLRLSLAKKGRQCVLSMYTHERIAEETLNVYRTILQ
jgi:glycosyltransferase involved in cell wall biosynthesis